MPIEITCEQCGKRLRVKDSVAGKRIKCPQCQHIFVVPEPGADNWHVKTPDGEEYGPIPRTEMDEWFTEGRITSETQLLQDGADQWQWAADVYPSLSTQQTSTGSGGFDINIGGEQPQAPAEETPFNFGEKSTPAPNDTGVPDFGASAPATDSGPMVAPTTPTPSMGTMSSPSGATGQSPRDQLSAALLGIFGGAWGVHSFYMGNKNKGIIQIVVTMLTCGAGAWWGIIEGFLLLGGKTALDAKGRPLRRERF